MEERIAPLPRRCLLPRCARILKPGTYGSLGYPPFFCVRERVCRAAPSAVADWPAWIASSRRCSPLVGLLVFVVLAQAFVGGGQVVAVDDDVARWVADNVPAGVEWVARVVTWLGGVVGTTVVTAVAVVVLWRPRRRVDAAFVGALGARHHRARGSPEDRLRAGPPRSREPDRPAAFLLVPERARRDGGRALRRARRARRRAGRVAAPGGRLARRGGVLALAIGASRVSS